MRFHALLFAATLPFAFVACSGSTGDIAAVPANDQAAAPTPAPGATPTTGRPFQTAVIADFDSPWAMDFLPDGRVLVTEKDGRLRLVRPLTSNGSAMMQAMVEGVPQVDSAGQGGLMDVVLHPGFAQNRLVYFSYSEARAGGKNVVLARARLEEPASGAPRLADVQTLLRGDPVDGSGHYSGRIAFAPDGHLFFTAGDRQKFDPAQDKSLLLGKVLRLTDTGQPAPGNPLAAQGFRPEVWSYGHRNLLGIAFDTAGNLWEQEMGPRHGDELNLILPGRNYGWPNVSNGDHYDGRNIPDHAPGDGYEAPKVFWNPAISPAGLMIYSGEMFPAWRNSAFIGGMNTPGLIRVQLNGTEAQKADQWDMDGQRIRDVAQGPDGAVWVLEDGTEGSRGRLLRLTPAG